MDFDDTPQEAAFRVRARAWLEAHAKPRTPDSTGSDPLREREDADAIRRAKAWQLLKFEAGLGCRALPKEDGGHGRRRPAAGGRRPERGRIGAPAAHH